MNNILITGSNRGIGHGLIFQYLQRSNWRIFATCHNPGKAIYLKQLAKRYTERLTILELDLADEDAILSTVGAVSQ